MSITTLKPAKAGRVKCLYCGSEDDQSYLFCKKHFKAIQKWIDTEGRTAALIWLERSVHGGLICRKIKEYDKV